jgi:hypothetical protein
VRAPSRSCGRAGARAGPRAALARGRVAEACRCGGALLLAKRKQPSASRPASYPFRTLGATRTPWAANACTSTKAGLAAGDPRDPVFASSETRWTVAPADEPGVLLFANAGPRNPLPRERSGVLHYSEAGLRTSRGRALLCADSRTLRFIIRISECGGRRRLRFAMRAGVAAAALLIYFCVSRIGSGVMTVTVARRRTRKPSSS